MRILSYIAIAGLFMMAKCDLFEELGTVNLNATVSHSEPISISEMDPVTIDKDFTVNATSNSEVEKYKEKIKSYTVKKISYQILNYVGEPGITMSGAVEFGAINAKLDQVDLSDETVTDLGLDPDDLAEVAADLEGGNTVSGSIAGTVSGKPVDFTLKLIFDIGFEAEVIE